MFAYNGKTYFISHDGRFQVLVTIPAHRMVNGATYRRYVKATPALRAAARAAAIEDTVARMKAQA